MWVEPRDPAVVSFITTGKVILEYEVPDMVDYSIAAALATAQAVLNGLTGNRIHTAGSAIEDFRATPFIHRVSTGKRPLIEVISAYVIESDSLVDTSTFQVSGNNIYFNNNGNLPSPIARVCIGLVSITLRLSYTYGSTVTPAARQALLDFARQLWLAVNPDAEGVCELPERVTSVSREGLSYTILDHASYLEKGQTGLPRVDLWIMSINPGGRATGYSGVFTPDSPPGTNRVITARRIPT